MGVRIGNFSNDGEMKIKGEVVERLPSFSNNLIASFPFDNSLESSNYVYSSLCDIKLSDGLEWFLPVDSPIMSDNGAYFNGNNTCYLRSQKNSKYDFNERDYLSVELEFCADSLRECSLSSLYSGYNYASRYTYRINLLSDGRVFGSVGCAKYYPTEYKNAGWDISCDSGEVKIEVGIWYHVRIVYDKTQLRLYLDGVLVGSVSSLGDTTKEDSSGVTQSYRRRELSASSYNGCIFVGADGAYTTNTSQITNIDNDPIVRVPAWSGKACFKGYIRDFKISKMCEPIVGDKDKLFDDWVDCVSDGVYVGDNVTNLGDMNVKGVGIYDNFSLANKTLVKLNETFMGMPVWRLGIKLTDADVSRLSSFQSTYHSHGIYVSGFTYKVNTEYCASIYYRSVNKDDISVGGTASNIIGWGDNYREEILNNGWKRVSTKRSVDTTQRSDSKYWSFICPSMRLNEWVYIDWAGHLFEEGKSWSGKYVPNTYTKQGLRYPNVLRNKGTISFKFKKNVIPSSGYMMPFRVANNVFELDIRSDRFLLHSGDYSFLKTNTWYHACMSWDISANTLKVYLDGVLKYSTTCPSYVNDFMTLYPDMYIGCGGDDGIYAFNGYIKDFNIYSVAISDSEVKRLCSSKFNVDKLGDIYSSGISEGLNYLPSGSVCFDLGEHTKDTKGFYGSSSESNIVFESSSFGSSSLSYIGTSYLEYNLPDLLGDNDRSWTILCMAKPNKIYMRGGNQRVCLFSVGDYYVLNKADVCVARWNASDTSRNFIGLVGFVNKEQHYSNNVTLSDSDMDKWGMYCIRYDKTTNTITFNLRTNTTNSSTSVVRDLVGLGSKLRVGGYSWDGSCWGGYIRDLTVIPKCVSDSELDVIYKSMVHFDKGGIGVKNRLIEGVDL